MAETNNTTTASERGPRTRVRSPHLVVNVTQEAIDDSIRRTSSHCMIADAIKAQLPKAKNVSVALDSIRWTDPEKRLRYIYLTPRVAQLALIHYDRGLRPDPFQFRIGPATQVTRTTSSMTAKQTPEGARELRRKNKQIRKQTRAQDPDQPFRVSLERRREIVKALEDPEANLGPATAMLAAGGDSISSHPVIVGGKSPPPGNLAKTRRFGLKQMIE